MTLDDFFSSNPTIYFHVFRWGYCDDASGLPYKPDNLVDHKYFEVETTVLPNRICGFQSQS